MSKRKSSTESFLQIVANHISSYPKYKKVEYIIEIADDKISMNPYVDVFPDRVHRKIGDKEWLIDHVLKHHLDDIEEDNSMRIVENNYNKYAYQTFGVFLQTGKYIYKLSVSGKRRQWIGRFGQLSS